MSRPPSVGKQAWELIESRLRLFLDSDGSGLERAREELEAALDGEVISLIDTALATTDFSYRDGVIIQLAFGLASSERLDLTKRQYGGRPVAGKLGRFFAANHVPGVSDAYQNIAKNTPELIRGNLPEFDAFLLWAANEARSRRELNAAFEYACAKVASTARPVRRMPDLRTERLTFAAVAAVFETLFAEGSQGANEQFASAALIHALIEQTGLPYRVETKSLNASDKSSRTAGDIQILQGNRVVEAFEVTAGPWEPKAQGAAGTIRGHDLSRIHIVSGARGGLGPVLARLRDLPEDVSALEQGSFVEVLTAALTRSFRAAALRRLYELLDR